MAEKDGGRKSPKLNQVIAIEKGVNSRATAEITAIHRTFANPALFNGFSKEYQPLNDDGEQYPPESKKVTEIVSDLLARVQKSKTELFDTVAQKDFANMEAKANVVLDGETLIANAPVPFLLFVEKQLTDMRTLIAGLPILDANEEWDMDSGSGLYKSAPFTTHRTAKVQEAIVKYPATDKHPAQTEMITKDVIAGHWTTIKQSGAITRVEQRKLAERVEKLLNAVKQAREEANMADAPPVKAGDAIFGYLFA
jgi:hypothetical protein